MTNDDLPEPTPDEIRSTKVDDIFRTGQYDALRNDGNNIHTEVQQFVDILDQFLRETDYPADHPMVIRAREMRTELVAELALSKETLSAALTFVEDDVIRRMEPEQS